MQKKYLSPLADTSSQLRSQQLLHKKSTSTQNLIDRFTPLHTLNTSSTTTSST